MKKQLFNLKNLVLILATGLLSLSSIAQMQIGNSDFENWDELGNTKERPANWNNMMNGDMCGACGLGQKQTTWRDSDTRPGSTGSYSVKIKTTKVTILFVTSKVNGAMTVGKLHAPSTTPSQGYNQTHRSDNQFSEVMTDKPDSLVFWAKYSITNNDDKARVSAVIHGNYDLRDPQDGPSAPHVVASLAQDFQTSGGWIRKSIPFNYSGPSTDAQYILITLTSSYQPGSGKEGATLWVDDLELIYNPTVEITPIAVQNLFENQNGTQLTATETNGTATSRQWKYSTTSGGPYTNSIAGATGLNYTPQFATAGTYYVVCESNFSGYPATSNEVKVVVTPLTVAIAPTTTQNLFENQAGTALTATENTVADSRQWKYATTTGGPYSTNIAGATAINYTPQFATAGTYYVVCESTLYGVTKTSNQVRVNVAAFAISIAPTAVQNLVEDQAGTDLTVTENAVADSRQWKYATITGGPYSTNVTGATGTNYTPQFATVGSYYVVCESTYLGVTKTSNEVQINVVPFAISIAPTAVQNIVENQPGTDLSVTENTTADTRLWKYATTAGGPYSNTISGATGTNYTPLFATAGTYYVVCESTFAGTTLTSNEVQINVTAAVSNLVSISPTSTQNLIENEVGTTINASETPAAAVSREWQYSVTSGSGYVSFATAQTGLSYTPQFATAGTYYVVCVSDFGGGDIATSNEVQINVVEFTNSIAPSANQNLIENQAGTDLTVTESPTAGSREWKFSATSGSGYASFATAETGTTYTPQFATAGTYYVVCESTISGITVTSNEVIINVVEFTNSIAPSADQDLIENEVGTDLTVTETPAADSREWLFSMTSGSGYAPFTTAETGTTYTPQFATAGTYYVVCESTIDGITVTSNEVTINVVEFTNSIAPSATQTLIENQAGTDLTVSESPVADSREWKFSTTSGSAYVSFSTAETGTSYTPQFATAGTYYVVCESTISGITVTSNEVTIEVIEFTNTIDPSADQTIEENEVGTDLTVTETPTADSREWMFSTTSGSGYASFSPAETGTSYTPQFATAGTYYVVCESTIDGITVTSNEVIIVVNPTVGIAENTMSSFAVYATDQKLNVDFSNMDIDNASLRVLSIDGKVIAKNTLEGNKMNTIQLSVPTGVYFYSISNGKEFYQGKVFVK